MAAAHVHDAGTDISARNAAITRAYAEIYHQDPHTFKWAGMAAFASCEVGHGIRPAEALRVSGLPWIPGLSDISGTEMSHALQRGNALVYEDIYWQLLSYQRCGLGDLEKARNEKRIPPEVFEAWQKIDRGKRTKDPGLVWEGNTLLLEYEQGTTLQEGVYDQNRPMWQKVSSWPFTWVQEIDSPIPGDSTSFQDYVEGGDIGDFDDHDWESVAQHYDAFAWHP